MLDLLVRLIVGLFIFPLALLLVVAVLYTNIKDYIVGGSADEHEDWWA